MKKTFKLFAACALAGVALVYTGCTKDYAEDIKDLDDRLTAVEKSVSELQSEIKAGAVITDVTSTSNGVKVTLSNGKSFEITNGKDGVDGTNGKDGVNGTNGTNGKDGSVITIGDNGNWFIDGKDTGMPSRGENGKDGVNGTNGTNGTDGKDGADGKDADQVYYKPGSNGCWIKVTVTPDGKVTEEQTTESFLPEGTITAVWENGALTLYNVENSPFGEPVVINLAGLITSLAYMPETLLDSRGVIDFVNFYVGGKSVGTLPATATYRVNPSSANISEEGLLWNFASRSVKTRVAAAEAQFEIVGAPFATRIPGQFEVKIKAVGQLPMQCGYDELNEEEQLLGALAVTRPDGGVIVSDEAYVQETSFQTYSIIDAKKYTATPSVKYPFDMDAPTVAVENVYDIALVHDQSINIYDYLESLCINGASTVEEPISKFAADINYEYVVTKEAKFLGSDKVTDHQKFVTFDKETGVIAVDQSFVSGTRAAIGKTPLFKVVLNIEGKKAATAFVRVGIVEAAPTTPSQPEAIVVPISATYDYKDLCALGKTPDAERVRVTWDEMTRTVLGPLNITNNQFYSEYDFSHIEYYVNGVEQKNGPITGVEAWYDLNGANINTNLFASFAVNNLIDENTTGKLVLVFCREGLYPDVKIEFSYTVNHTHNWPDLNPDYLIAEKTVQVKGRLEDTWVLKSKVTEHFKEYLKKYEPAGNHGAIQFALQPLVNGVPVKIGTIGTAIPNNAVYQTGATIEHPTSWADADFQLTEALTTDHRDYIVTMYEQLANGHFCETYYTVRFVCPFTISLNDVALKTLIEPQSVDLAKQVVIKDSYGKTIYEKGAYTKGAASYKLEPATLDEFGIVYATSGNDTEASFGNNLTLEGSKLTWDNDGADLQNNKSANYKVTVTIPGICKLTEKTGKITVLSVANSK